MARAGCRPPSDFRRANGCCADRRLLFVPWLRCTWPRLPSCSCWCGWCRSRQALARCCWGSRSRPCRLRGPGREWRPAASRLRHRSAGAGIRGIRIFTRPPKARQGQQAPWAGGLHDANAPIPLQHHPRVQRGVVRQRVPEGDAAYLERTAHPELRRYASVRVSGHPPRVPAVARVASPMCGSTSTSSGCDSHRRQCERLRGEVVGQRCAATQSSRSWSMRACQPSPVDLKYCTTSWL